MVASLRVIEGDIMYRALVSCLAAFAVLTLSGCGEDKATPSPSEVSQTEVDLIITNGMIYDGLGGEPFQGGIAVDDDMILAVGDVSGFRSDQMVDANGEAISPGFINMLSWGVQSLIVDGRGLSDIAQGVTLEVFGEGYSMGPISPILKAELEEKYSGDFPFKVEWETFGEYLEYLVDKGVSPNVASFLGATTVRINHIGLEDKAPTPEQLAAMQAEVRASMEEGAMGIGSSLIYAPAFYADTEELVALMQAAAPYGGSYISHLRSEGTSLLEAVEELIEIAKRSGAPAEIYHLKAAGLDNWDKMPKVIDRVNEVRAQGIEVRANMYTYTAGATGLDAAMPPWVQAGSQSDWSARLQDPETRARVKAEMKAPDGWESLWLAAGDPEKLLFASFKNPDLKKYTGLSLADVMAERGTDAEDTMMDLVIEDGSRVGTIYFLMSPENMALKVKTPWVSFGSDGGAIAPEGNFLKSSPHPRAYGNFTRLLGKYVREDGLISPQEAIRRMTSMPADNLKLRQRGRLAPGYKADIVVFDPATIGDKATFARSHQLATGVTHVFVNGSQVLKDGEHTGALPGQVVRGPGWTGWKDAPVND